jgi:rhodanese-related sulfurtransferase
MRSAHIFYLSVATVAIVAGIVFYAYWYATVSPLHISADAARKQIADGMTIVLDVRTDPEYALGHYDGAIHIKSDDLVTQAPGLLPLGANIIAYCNTGQRSRMAAETLKRMGYENVRYISGPYWSISSRGSN